MQPEEMTGLTGLTGLTGIDTLAQGYEQCVLGEYGDG